MEGTERGHREGADEIDRDPGAKRAADAELAKVVNSINHGRHVEPNRITVREFLERWLRDYVAIHVEKTSTRDGYARRVRRHLIPELGAAPLAKLAAARLQTFRRVKLEKGLSSTTVNDLNRVMHLALESTVKWGLVGRNACGAAEPPKKRHIDLTVWTPAQCQRFLATARESDNRCHPVFAAALFTGMRQGELLGLRWSDVDLGGGAARVQQTLQRAGARPVFGMPKTERSRRRVLLLPELVAALRRIKVAQDEERREAGDAYRDHGLVFAVPDGAPIHASNLQRRRFFPRIEEAGVPKIRFRDLRHSQATLVRARLPWSDLPEVGTGRWVVQFSDSRYHP